MMLLKYKRFGKTQFGLLISGQDLTWDRLNTIISNLTLFPLRNWDDRNQVHWISSHFTSPGEVCSEFILFFFFLQQYTVTFVRWMCQNAHFHQASSQCSVGLWQNITETSPHWQFNTAFSDFLSRYHLLPCLLVHH